MFRDDHDTQVSMALPSCSGSITSADSHVLAVSHLAVRVVQPGSVRSLPEASCRTDPRTLQPNGQIWAYAGMAVDNTRQRCTRHTNALSGIGDFDPERLQYVFAQQFAKVWVME